MEQIVASLSAFLANLPAFLSEAANELMSIEFYGQIGLILVAVAPAWIFTRYAVKGLKIFREQPVPGVLYDMRRFLHGGRHLLLPLSAVVLLLVAGELGAAALGKTWLIQIAQGVAVIFLIYRIANHFISNATIVQLLKWIGIPIALLQVAGWLDDVIAHLEAISFEVGNIKISLYAVIRTFLFGAILFWLGRFSNSTGQRLIRNRTSLDVSTREVIAKLFEIGIYVIMFLLLLNVMGVDLTALAVFGGALGVGLGFGLQQIASNFISGIIILLDRTITIGDYIQLEDGRAGTLRELTMRAATLETYDGKDIMVPNERFITTAFTNWTHNNKKQRYPLHFQVAYDTDLEKLFEIVREVVAGHPRVLSGDGLPLAERPDAEIESFGDSGINILVEFWMEGIDDGDNRVGADLLLMIWTALKANGIHIPFPQREIKILGDSD